MRFTTKCNEGEHVPARFPGVDVKGCTKCLATVACSGGGIHVFGDSTQGKICFKCSMPYVCTDGTPHIFGTIPAKDRLVCQKCGRSIEEAPEPIIGQDELQAAVAATEAKGAPHSEA